MTSSIFEAPARLPRGPHALPRAEIVASQRARLMAATAEVVAESGYPEATIAAITGRAGVSPRSFYEHFDGKLDCFLAGYDRLVEVLIERIAEALAEEAGWPEFIASALSAYLETLEADPTMARAFLVEIEAAGPVARRRRRDAYERFAAVIKARHEEIRRTDPSLGPVPDLVYLAIVHGIRDLVADQLEAQRRPRLTEIGPAAEFLIAASVRGAEAAAADIGRPRQDSNLRPAG